MPGASENRVWQKTLATVETRQAEPLQSLGGHQENGSAGYDIAVDSLLAAEGGGTTLFRAVNPAELSDLSANGGVFRNLGSAEGKYFSTTAEGAGSYAQQTFGTGLYEGPYTVVQTTIPSSSLTPVMGASVDRGISTIVVPNNLLPSLSPANPLPFIPLKVP